MQATVHRIRKAAVTAAWVASLAVSALSGQAQKPALDHEDTYRWNDIAARSLSPDGRWAAYVIEPWEGDPTMVVVRTDGSGERRTRGTRPVFTRDSRFVAFGVPPLKSVIDSLKLEGTGDDDLPGDSLAVLRLAPSGAIEEALRVGPIEEFAVPEDGGAWIAYRLAPPQEDEEGEEGEEAGEPGEEEPAPGAEPEPGAGGPEAEASGQEEPSEAWKKWHEKEEGTVLVVRDLESEREQRFEHALTYVAAPDGSRLAYAASTEEGDGDGVWIVDPESGAARPLLEGEGHYRNLAFDEAGSALAFVSDRDDWDSERPEYALYRADAAAGPAERRADRNTEGVPAGWWVSEHGELSFSEDGERLFFGTAPIPEPEPDEDVLDEDRVRLDVWNWRDDYLQPMQLVDADEERERTYLAVAHEDRADVVQLGSIDVPDIDRTRDGTGEFVLGTTDVPYRQELSWDGRYQDAYAIGIHDGERRRIVSAVRGFAGANLSPGGSWAYWWDEEERGWKVASMAGGEPAPVSASIPYAVHDELDDHPQGSPPYGFPVWTEEDEALLVYDRFDVWRTDPTGREEPVRLTEGRRDSLRYRVLRPGYEQVAVANGPILLSVADRESKASGYARGRSDRAGDVRHLVLGEHAYGTPVAARDGDAHMWTRETFREYPDLRASGPDFSDPIRLSDVNPQQSEYRWGSAELVSWVSVDGIPLDGLLYTPDGFDPSSRYPMMVYFYERMSDNLHDYESPTPGSSSIAVSFYVSRGYLVFIPDIPYEIGYPGESALDAVVPGVLSLVARGFVDPSRIGVQGHSWGGYQIAYMITKTDLFAAAEAGAPVSNMTSAYGGIRWQSGMSRMFQYERTQSRIGGSLWEATHEYIHNSPVFFAHKIGTPLLMMHNDEDGAVPWYQGIEMFVAMRRLGKPAFMLNYNGEAHGLRRRANREDWAIRMQQFFDHYLRDAPPPVWIAEGVPAVLKGRDLGLELTETAVSEEGG